ncbi:S-adenosylmethionine decarboxylase proenzyme S-adenosylmethionine decarboxylase alpha chain S-adenosylmethionine decarboxylase beta chain [Zea mays]|uniref:S-adenosylmethionine decarboxylase proenzyme S-adenosylmethionine decarboxylase alpha chain S-adenosylmethionine decarboxylase beta chain n=1 Tax=Zea mays TaxID=4577 RepID=A0A1D6E757_MAIZE|nr:S-adenosylmethionine decarboxylase proenzyme S-adenosylmethionine decarboxylase alpha chain S-adenosylmethionine decarboxylase beta chain [Zea mays]
MLPRSQLSGLRAMRSALRSHSLRHLSLWTLMGVVCVTIFGGRGHAGTWGKALGAEVYDCNNMVEQELPGGGLLVYQSFCAAEDAVATSPKSVFHCFDGENVESAPPPMKKDYKLANLLCWEEEADAMEEKAGVLDE